MHPFNTIVNPFPSNIVVISQRPDIIFWNECLRKMYIIELTVCHESNFDSANERKTNRYYKLLESVKEKGYRCVQFNILVGSRGFLHLKGIISFCQFLSLGHRDRKSLLLNIIKHTIEESFKIWIIRNRL